MLIVTRSHSQPLGSRNDLEEWCEITPSRVRTYCGQITLAAPLVVGVILKSGVRSHPLVYLLWPGHTRSPLVVGVILKSGVRSHRVLIIVVRSHSQPLGSRGVLEEWSEITLSVPW